MNDTVPESECIRCGANVIRDFRRNWIGEDGSTACTDGRTHEGGDYTVPESVCWNCHVIVEGAMDPSPDPQRPTPGATAVCIYCGIINIYDENILQRRPTEAELDARMEDRAFVNGYMNIIWRRNYLDPLVEWPSRRKT